MKKVLVFALVLSLVLGSFSFAFAANFDDTEGLDCEGAVNVLTELGVISGYPDGTYKPEGIVTRAEMAKLLIVALGMEDYVKGAYAAFPDVPGSHWATSYIAYASSLGIIEGYPDGTFKPNATVTYQEAATMIIRALGYQDAYLTGTWPASHVNMALSLGILDGIIASADGANRGDVAIMIYQALDCTMITYDSLGNAQERNDNMLLRLGAQAANPDRDGKPLPIVITKQLVDDAAIEINDLLGAFATVYLNKDGDVIVVKEVNSEFVTGEVDAKKGEITLEDDTVYSFDKRADQADYYPQFEDEAWTYNSTTSVWTRSATTGAAFDFYNGAQNKAMVGKSATSEVGKAFVASEDDVFTLAVKISGKYITDVYSIQSWQANEELLWDADLAEELADDLTVDGWEFSYTNRDEIDLETFVLEGVDSLDAIPEDAVVTVYADTDDVKSADISKIEVGTETAVGKVTKIASSKYTIDGTAYELSDSMSDTAKAAVKLGEEGTFYLNYQGDIAFYEADSYAGNYSMVLENPKAEAVYGSGTEYKIYLLDKEGEDTVQYFKNLDAYDAATKAGIVADQLITAKYNKDGKIVETTNETSGLVTATSLSAKGVMGGKLIVDDVVVFIYDGTDWYVGELAELKTDTTWTTATVKYGTNDDGKIDVIVVSDQGDAVSKVTDFGFFTSKGQEVNADEEDIFSGKALIAGAEVEYVTTEQTSALGDATADRGNLYVLEYDGTAIDTAVKAKVTQAAVTLEDFGAFDVIEFDSAAVNAEATTIGGIVLSTGETGYEMLADVAIGTDANAYFYKVHAKDGDRIDLGKIASGSAITNPDYQLIEGADYYKVTLNDDDTFKKLAAGSASDVRAGAWVILLQLDEDSDNWDTVIYVTKSDATDLTWNI